jgi:chromosome segregation ATPase
MTHTPNTPTQADRDAAEAWMRKDHYFDTKVEMLHKSFLAGIAHARKERDELSTHLDTAWKQLRFMEDKQIPALKQERDEWEAASARIFSDAGRLTEERDAAVAELEESRTRFNVKIVARNKEIHELTARAESAERGKMAMHTIAADWQQKSERLEQDCEQANIAISKLAQGKACLEAKLKLAVSALDGIQREPGQGEYIYINEVRAVARDTLKRLAIDQESEKD